MGFIDLDQRRRRAGRHLQNDAKHISFNHLGIISTIGFAVSHHLAHTGAQFVRPVGLPGKSADDGILWKRCECGRTQ